jgi:hypothetical protein
LNIANFGYIYLWMIATWATSQNWKEKEKEKKKEKHCPNPFKRTFQICLRILRIFTFTHKYPHGKHWKKGKDIPLQLSCKKGKWWSLTLTLTENLE